MNALLSSGTDAAGMVLFDPQAAREALAASPDVGDDEVVAAAALGALLYWYTAADGTMALGVYVDEPVPAALLARAEHGASGLLLRVPSGRLVFAGVEILGDLQDEPARWPGDEPGLDLAPGDYVLEAFEVAWSDADDRAFKADLRAEVGAVAMRATDVLGMVTGLLVMVTIASAIPAFVMLVARPARFLEALAMAGPWLLIAWLVVFGLWRLPVVRRIEAARRRLEAAHPDAIVSLRRLPDGAARPERGGSFGVGYADAP